mmetsp:Transcript_88747/g.249961  ORF Transcript_88747/g.249961 Transcript_88747/m.249961 type:complete len:530 (-) Transcript_88747:92-1681(-)
MSAGASDFTVGCRVYVLPGRKFDAFGAGDRGVVVRKDTGAISCEVIFDGHPKQVPVALRHLAVARDATDRGLGEDGKLPENIEPIITKSKKGVENQCKASVSVREADGQTGFASRHALGHASAHDAPGMISHLGPIEAAYDGVYKWKGCALAADGCLYCAPYGATTVLRIDPHEQTLTHIEGAGVGECKWSGIAAGGDGLLYCAPCKASTVLVIDPEKQSLRHIEGVGDDDYKWSGITAAADGRLYCAPSRASSVLVIDPKTQALSHIAGAGRGSSKWSGIAEGPDGRLYCAPSMATAVLVVDPMRQHLSRLEGAMDGSTFKYKWSGVAMGWDGKLYCAPYNANSVLVIDPVVEELSFITAAGAEECKWSGIAAGLDGRLYCVPSRARRVLVVDPRLQSLADLGDVGRGNAKWSGLCVGLDRWLYCTPYNVSNVLAIKGGRGAVPRAADTATAAARLAHDFGDDPYAVQKEDLRVEFGEMLALPSGQRLTRYRELCRRWHPDKNPDDPCGATVVFQFLQQLHERFGAST